MASNTTRCDTSDKRWPFLPYPHRQRVVLVVVGHQASHHHARATTKGPSVAIRSEPSRFPASPPAKLPPDLLLSSFPAAGHSWVGPVEVLQFSRRLFPLPPAPALLVEHFWSLIALWS
ncbi:hypothetical protein SLEP1_g16088 [Rubroshorea leprosula]|uniref:Uncharacterized protein n=1 Tax=Rubroshorea leprosula TaxID=152421 RepID=A0AAV5IPQ0_9ROSI|nr:hypothetical protein SLEP1_g16088 [Rubroshorea leprosula]